MGSVKNLKIIEKAEKEKMGLGVFDFTNDYSVFDFGKMPDEIPNKGESICRMASYNFKELSKLGIKNHFIEMPKGSEMKVKLVRVLYPQKNEISENETNYLVPLEIIFRNSLPKGSSVFKRIEKKETTWEELGLDFVPEPGTKLEKPILDVSTKLESKDRYLTWDEAQKLSFLTDEQMSQMKSFAQKINEWITQKSQSIGLEHADGKVEFAIDDSGELMLVDVVGTPDENRLIFNEINVNKQVLRDYYTTTSWAKEVEENPKNAPKPENLPKELIDIASQMYMSVSEHWTGENVWNTPQISEVVETYQNFLKRA